MTDSRKPRKSYEELVDAIVEALPVRSFTTIQEIARKTKSSWETVWRWLHLILYIQGLPEIQKMKSPLGRGEVYSRERRKGE